MTTTNAPSPRSVRFSEMSELAFIPNDDATDKAYRRDDVDRFKQDLLGDVQVLSRLVHQGTPRAVPYHDLLCACNGLEAFVTRGLARQVEERKRAHRDAILDGQPVLSKRALAKVSEASSRWARERAEKIAMC